MCDGEDNGHESTGVLRTVETQIIPRLLLSYRGLESSRQAETPAPHHTDREAIDIAEFARLVISQDAERISRYLTTQCEQGASLEWLYLELLSPTAQHIGRLWEEDLCGIVDVTLAVGLLQHVLRELSPTFQEQQGYLDSRRRGLFLPMPGEQHTFGLSLITEFFRRAGWDLWSLPAVSEEQLLALVSDEWFAILGISISAEVNLAGLATLIQKIRRASGNRSLGVMVGGPLFVAQPQLSKEVGADATAVDARQAVLQAESLLTLQ